MSKETENTTEGAPVAIASADMLEKHLRAPFAEDAPIVKIGRFTLSECGTDDRCNKRIWIDDNQEDAGDFRADLLEAHIEEFYNKYF